ncbi:MAG: DUF1570 domain-containing protein [Thermoguttaceae bacterium]|nr:DUF1570 domain-containing protein [Thermoguttaceae bacterium]MDW8077911.1 DUF1570 domain-containing protein [Thermoguttaceae bacterium]
MQLHLRQLRGGLRAGSSVHLPLYCGFAVLFSAIPSLALDHVTVEREGRKLTLTGRVRVEAADGSLLFETRDGSYWLLSSDQILERSSDAEPFRAFTAEELAQQLRQEFGPGFSTRKTGHYLIVYNCGDSYAAWCGWLFERLYGAFQNFWSRRGLALSEPEYPLVAIVFRNQRDFTRYATADVGGAASAIIGYYHLEKNRMILYDLTETSGLAPQSGRRSVAEINRLLNHPQASRAVATIVHEATHQLCFNCGMFSRMTETPLWLSEGIAMFFETPDLQSTAGWAGVGEKNPKRAADFYAYLPRRARNSLATLIQSDDRFRDTSTAIDAYAEAWALSYYLLRKYPQKTIKYIKKMKDLPIGGEYPPDARLRDFQEVFGDLEAVEAEFLRSFSR